MRRPSKGTDPLLQSRAWRVDIRQHHIHKSTPAPVCAGPGHGRPQGVDMTDRTCLIAGCTRPVDWGKHCPAHRTRINRTGHAGPAEVAVKGRPKPPCKVDGCDRPRKTRDLCDMHYQRLLNNGDANYVPPPPRGERNNSWRGDNILSGAAHRRVVVLRGPASSHPCINCGDPAKHWAYDHKDPDEKPNVTTASGRNPGPYSVKPEHYQPMCVPCHKRYDLATIQAQAKVDAPG